jgi:hypothetical protein
MDGGIPEASEESPKKVDAGTTDMRELKKSAEEL